MALTQTGPLNPSLYVSSVFGVFGGLYLNLRLRQGSNPLQTTPFVPGCEYEYWDTLYSFTICDYDEYVHTDEIELLRTCTPLMSSVRVAMAIWTCCIRFIVETVQFLVGRLPLLVRTDVDLNSVSIECVLSSVFHLQAWGSSKMRSIAQTG
jgi:hypothetical protein